MSRHRLGNDEDGFKGFYVPAKYWLDDNLELIEVLFLLEIKHLDKGGGCTAKNDHFAWVFDLSPSRASQIINDLGEKGYLDIDYRYHGVIIVERIIKCLK